MSGVLVVAELRAGGPKPLWNRMTFEALAAGQQLAATLGTTCSAVVLGQDITAAAHQLAGYNLQTVHALDHPLLAVYTPDAYVHALAPLIRELGPAYIVFPHTYQVRDFAPALATRFDQVLLSDVVAIHPGNTFIRQLLQGKLNAGYLHVGQGPCFLSIQAGTYNPESLVPGTAVVSLTTPELHPSQIRTRPSPPFREATQTVDLSASPIIVSVGRGIREQENIALVQELADALGGELAASRPICDSGWLPMERQVGSSGQTVAPKLYLAIGISGAIQHLVGMKASKAVIAINKDEKAPIFEVADFGVVGDLFEIVPALTTAILQAKA